VAKKISVWPSRSRTAKASSPAYGSTISNCTPAPAMDSRPAALVMAEASASGAPGRWIATAMSRDGTRSPAIELALGSALPPTGGRHAATRTSARATRAAALTRITRIDLRRSFR
jgi:hypothetical protein